MVTAALKFTVTNSGKFEAQHIYPFGIIIPTFTDETDIKSIPSVRELEFTRDKFCKKQIKRPIDYRAVGITLGSGGTDTVIGIYKLQPAAYNIWIQPNPSGYHSMLLVMGCIDYVVGKQHHQQSFFAEIDKRGLGENPFLNIKPGDLPLAPSQLLIGRSPGLPTTSF